MVPPDGGDGIDDVVGAMLSGADTLAGGAGRLGMIGGPPPLTCAVAGPIKAAKSVAAAPIRRLRGIIPLCCAAMRFSFTVRGRLRRGSLESETRILGFPRQAQCIGAIPNKQQSLNDRGTFGRKCGGSGAIAPAFRDDKRFI